MVAAANAAEGRITSGRIKQVVIAGGGTAGWMAAAALSYYFGKTLNIILVESDDIGTVGVGEATIPQIQLFNSSLGIDEREFLRATGATFKLGIEFSGWSRPGESYFHGFGEVGQKAGMLPFYQYWLRYRAEGGKRPLDDFSANVLAARAGKFGKSTRTRGSAPSLAYAYHLDAALLAAHLRAIAEARGVRRIAGTIAAVRQKGESGHITSLCLSGGPNNGGAEVAGDLFIDCTGFRGLLIGQSMDSAFEDWSHWLPCDRAWAVPTKSAGSPEPFTRSTAREAGWQWHIPLQHRTGNGLVFSQLYWDEDRARETLLANLTGEALAEPRLVKFTTGRRVEAWKGNCIALGLASGFMEPLESTSIHMIQSGIARLVSLFPAGGFEPAAIAEYNAQSAFEAASVRDFLILHYRLNEREGEFWRYCRTMPIPDTLAQKLALFQEAGTINRFNTELFDLPSWMQVMWGQGLRPRGYHPMVDAVPKGDLARYIELNASKAAAQVNDLPPHSAFLTEFLAEFLAE